MLTHFRSTDYLRSEYVVPTKRAISEELLPKIGYSLSSRYFVIHSNEKTNKRLDKTRVYESCGQYSFLSLFRHFVCFENDHRHGDHIMVADVHHCFRFFQNWHTPELCPVRGSRIVRVVIFSGLVNSSPEFQLLKKQTN